MARKQFAFEKLEVWQDASKPVIGVYQQTRAFPKSELYGVTSQLDRASVSVVNNLAEGCARSSLKDQAHFSNQSYGSLMETASGLIVSQDLGFVPSEAVDALLDLAVRTNNFRESQVRRAANS